MIREVNTETGSEIDPRIYDSRGSKEDVWMRPVALGAVGALAWRRGRRGGSGVASSMVLSPISADPAGWSLDRNQKSESVLLSQEWTSAVMLSKLPSETDQRRSIQTS